ncbi:hypothetical protein ABW19_dt0207341 [Dactylella cylindrospora]|nr:hypothetical protein ABW19_dt0207341 [Dactylella cylindrospora]
MSGASSSSSAFSNLNATISKENPIGNGLSSSGGGNASGSQQTEWVRRTNGVSSSNTPVNSISTNQSGPRRPSLSTTLTHHSRDHYSSAATAAATTPSSSSASYQPQHTISRDVSNPFRYSKEYMLNKFEGMEANGLLSDSSRVNKLLLGESEKEGLFGGGAWGSKERNGNGTEACWDPMGSQRPVSFEPISSDEKELFQSVNSVQKPHQTPNTPGGPNSVTGLPGQGNQPRSSTSLTNLNSSYHKPNASVSSTGATIATSGTASPTTRNRPRRDTAENNPFPPIGRRRTDRNTSEDASNPFDRFVGRSQPYGPSTNDDGRDLEDQSAGPPSRGFFKRQNSTGWGVSSPVTPGGSAQGAFANGAFGGIGSSSFMLNSGVPVAKSETDKKFGGSIGRSAGRSLVADKVDEENEDEEAVMHTGDKPVDPGRQEAYESSLQQLSKESEAEPDLERDGYGRRPGSTDTDPFNPRESLQLGDLDLDNPLDEKPRTPHGQLGDPPGYFGEVPSGPIGRNIMGTPTRNLGGGMFGGGLSSLGVGSNVASPSSTRQSQHTPLSGFHPLQTQGQIGTGMSGSQGSEPLSPSDTNPYQSPLPEAEDAAGDDDGTGQPGMRTFRPPGGSDRSQTSSAGIIGTGLPGLGGLGGFNNPLGTPGLWSNPPLPREGGIGTITPQTAGGLGGMGPGGSFFDASGEPSGLGTPGATSSRGFGTRASRLGQLFPVEQQQQLQQHQELQRQQNRSFLQDDGGFDPNEALRALTLSDNAKADNRNSADSLFGAPGPARGLMGGGDNPYFGVDAEGSVSGQSQAGQQQIQPKSSFPTLTHSNSVSSLQQFPGGPAPGVVPGSSSQPPSQRSSGGHIMIMPDKIAWVYKDPTGKIQGPFSGLEMHDWYKAGFFQPDLQIKRQEDGEFEPLGQFIRRVGNSREPFLIPMQGPAFPPGQGWATPNPWGQNTIDAANGIVQPPFPGAFPSFGTTLTAEQQNALERRKQEEQYLMARQREYLVQQQVLAKQVAAAQHMTRMSQESLHHHPSQASLHSQPSLGSLQSPGGFTVTQNASQPGAFSNELRHTTSNPSLDGPPGQNREEYPPHGFPGMQTPQGFGPPGASAPSQTQQTSREQAQLLERQRAQLARQYQNQHQMLEARQQQQRMLQQAAGQQHGNQGLVQGQQAGAQQRDMPAYQVARDEAIDSTQDSGFDNDARPDMTGTAHADEYELFQQQHQLQIQQHEENLRLQQQRYNEQGQLQYLPTGDDFDISQVLIPHQQLLDNDTINVNTTTSNDAISAGPGAEQATDAFLTDGSVTESAIKNESISNEMEYTTERRLDRRAPSPPPPINTHIDPPKNPWGTISQSAMPLPFPAPKSVTSPRPSTAQSQTKSPSIAPAETPTVSIAPWAKDLENASHPKGPSLKEIQEIEAKQAAKAEAAALEARRQEQAQQAALAAASAPPPTTSGLPSSSNWATTPTTTNASAWTKPLAKSNTGVSSKKTLAQIQKEEEMRKQKALAQAALGTSTSTTTIATPQAPATARRSEWASKVAAVVPNTTTSSAPGGAWTTVGAGGKKIGGPTVVTAHPRPAAAPATTAVKTAKKPASAPPSAAATAQKTAQDEFTKWCKINLKGLNPGVNVDDFLNMIMSFPLEVDLISDSVYQQSTTIDGRRFAEEFIRRRKLAQQGVVVDHGHGEESKSSNSSGWNEVAKKGREGSASSTSGTTGDSLGNGSFKVVQGKKKKR